MPAPRRRGSVLPAIALAVTGGASWADEGGVSFWLPGQYASFAAVAPRPRLLAANAELRLLR